MSENEKFELTFDAFMGGVQDGGLRSTLEIHMLICYLVANVGSRMTAEVIAETVVEGEIANYFETASALQSLIDRGLIIKDNRGYLTASDKCKEYIGLVEKELPRTVRTRALELASKLAVRRKFEKENGAEIKEKDGNFFVTLHLKSEADFDVMTLTLLAASNDEAQEIKDRFFDDPITVYNEIMKRLS